MACPRCGSATMPGQKFCPDCGFALGPTCPNCGTPYDGSPRFCADCGTQLATETRLAGQVAVDAAALAPPDAERRYVSVLFADLVGFTQLSEQQDAEEVRELLSRYFETARQVIEGYGGQVEKFIGDAVMAVWGAPVAHEDDAERAVRAALELVERVKPLHATGQPLLLRAAVLSGEAAVTPGRVGEGMVAGDLVNTASRLQSVAPPGVVLVGEATQRATNPAIAYEPAGEQVLRGKKAPVAAWRALRVVARVGGEGRGDGLEPPFVGRDEEFRLLRDQVHAAEREGKSRLVAITGQAGMGKSRLAWELEKYLDGLAGTTYYWHQGRSPAYGEGVTFWALGEMVRRRARISESEDEASTREKLRATLADFVPDVDERRRLEPALGALLGIDEADWDAREQLFSAWRTLFERIADRGPTVLVFEDLQWADTGLLDFIEHLLEWTRSKPILVVTLARPELLERRPGWGMSHHAFIAVHLQPLSDEAMSILLRGVVADMPEDELRRVVARAEGVPLYAVETVRLLLDGGYLERDGDVYRLVRDLPALEVPPTLHALIASRLDALDTADRALLQDAAVLGVAFAGPALAALSGRPPGELEPRLRALSQKELVALETDPRSPERGQYRFVQGLIREVAYGTLAKRDRRTRHLAAARYFETLGDDELAGVLASHYLEAYRAAPETDEGRAVAAQARVALRAAADRASRLHSPEQALTYLEQGLAVTFEEEEQVEIRLQAAEVAATIGRNLVAEEHLKAAMSFFEARGDRLRAAQTAARLAWLWNTFSQIDDAIALVQDKLADLPPGSEQAAVDLNAELGRAYMFKGEADKALGSLSKALSMAERSGLRRATLLLLITKAWALMHLQQPAEAIALMWGVMRMADDTDDVHTQIRARMNLSSFLSVDDPRASFQVADSGLALARQYGMAQWGGRIAGNAVSVAALIGDLRAARALEEEFAEVNAGSLDEPAVVGYGAVTSALLGDLERARIGLARVEAILRNSTSNQDLAGLNVIRALIEFGAGRLAAVVPLAREARRLYRGGESIVATHYAARAALLLGDVSMLRDEHAALADAASGRVWANRAWRTAGAGLLALEGRSSDALVAYRGLIEEWRTADLPFDLALTLLDRSLALGSLDEEAAAGRAEAALILDEIGAEGLADRLESAARGQPGTGNEPIGTPVRPSQRVTS